MVDDLRLEFFKCFTSQVIQFGDLTILSGANSAGKSSVLQALVLLSDFVKQTPWPGRLDLNRDGLRLGAVRDVINAKSTERSMLGVRCSNEEIDFNFGSTNRQGLSMEFRGIELKGYGNLNGIYTPSSVTLAQQNDFVPVKALRKLKWISSERLGPRDLLPLEDSQSVHDVGFDGRNAAGILHWSEDRDVSEAVAVQGIPKKLFNQVRARLREVFPNAEYRVVRVDNAVAVSLGFKTGTESEFQRPQNVGFGFSQVFPIIVELLLANPGEMVLIENPEIHLHPKAQQELAIFIARIAASGVQIVVETHSDHIINGFRLAVRRALISGTRMAIHFFAPNSAGGPTVTSPTVDEEAKLSAWPEGFFDQYDRALAELL